MDILHCFSILYLQHTVCMLHREHISFHTSRISRSPFLNRTRGQLVLLPRTSPREDNFPHLCGLEAFLTVIVSGNHHSAAWKILCNYQLSFGILIIVTMFPNSWGSNINLKMGGNRVQDLTFKGYCSPDSMLHGCF